jgi:hypothetical protein
MPHEVLFLVVTQWLRIKSWHLLEHAPHSHLTKSVNPGFPIEHIQPDHQDSPVTPSTFPNLMGSSVQAWKLFGKIPTHQPTGTLNLVT